ncbi:unnamed protein product [Polarella glacialis]|uniref:Uncharacterized protein n=1 Tax=Polarella glacialis TaxID=89957 RepID=A0A813DME7_POLGL|nr:unnamed protein product [Polarella glacialis]CAE8598123.1 unnamed protein product [Polarella glacialis]CAE8740809.1 unnamed protein product [Polarella glacialis]
MKLLSFPDCPPNIFLPSGSCGQLQSIEKLHASSPRSGRYFSALDVAVVHAWSDGESRRTYYELDLPTADNIHIIHKLGFQDGFCSHDREFQVIDELVALGWESQPWNSSQLYSDRAGYRYVSMFVLTRPCCEAPGFLSLTVQTLGLLPLA